jgi:hypothetical protein
MKDDTDGEDSRKKFLTLKKKKKEETSNMKERMRKLETRL